MSRSYLFVSSSDPRDARRAVLTSLSEPDLAVVSPSDDAHETAGYAVGGADVLARFARVIRGLIAYEARSLLVVIDGLDVLGATAFNLAEDGVLRWANDLERSLPSP
jgi:hypothetical protein